MSRLPIGAQLFTLRDHTQTADDFASTCRRLADIGFSAMQVSAIGKDIDPQEVAEVAAEAGIAIAATHVGWERCLSDLDAIIAEHKLWNCHHTAIGSLPWDEYLSISGAKRFGEEVGPIADRLAEAGISFSYHNHAREFAHFAGQPWMQTMHDHVRDSKLCFELDVH